MKLIVPTCCAVAAVAAVMGLLSGCSSPSFSDSYKPIPAGEAEAQTLDVKSVKVYYGGNHSDVKKNAYALNVKGYVRIGYSLMVSDVGDLPDNINEQLAELAKKVHATVVVWYSDYLGSTSGYTPLLLPDVRTSHTSANGSVYGNGGSVSYFGNSTTTEYGTRELDIPYRHDYAGLVAMFLAPIEPPVLGVRFRNTNNRERHIINSNKGVVLMLVIEGTPAFNADFLPGDIITAINGRSVLNGQDFKSQLANLAGQMVTITYWRHAKRHTKKLRLNNPS